MLALSEEHEELRAAVRALLERRGDSAAVRRAAAEPRGYDEKLWQTLCEQIGAAALAVPEEYGGAGFSLFETHLVIEELGAALLPCPLLGSGVLAAQAILRSGDERACERLLPAIAEGRSVAALAWADAHGWSPQGSGVRASGGAEDWTLSGTAHHVLEGDTADVLLAVAVTDAGTVGLFEVDTATGVRREHTPSMDTTLRLARVDFQRAPARPLCLDAGALLAALYDIAAVAVTALQVGGARRGLDMTVAHTRERVQFGRPIGSFQALKHRMADLLVEVESARSASWAAAWSAARGSEELARDAATAKAWCSEAFTTVAAETVQMHGGIAITWEHDAQMVFKRAHATAQLFGQPHEHRRRLAAMLGLTE